jgi:colanic acid biosynthesis glycosyl transferase WcaI
MYCLLENMESLQPANIRKPATSVMIICPEFPPEPSSSAIMAEQLSRALADDGFSVTVVTAFPNRPAGKLYAGFKRQLRKIEQWGQVKVIRCPNWLLGSKRKGFSRILENITFGITSSLNALREPRPDLILVETWPIIAPQFNLWMGKFRKSPVLYYIQDVYPEIAVDVGVFKEDSRLARFLLNWDAKLCRNAAGIVAISDTMKRLLSATRGVPDHQVQIIHNWVDQNAISPLSRLNTWRELMKIPAEKFVLMYAGILGLVSGVDVLLDVAKRVEGSNVQIICIGQGPLKEEMMRKASEKSLSGISFYDFQEQSYLSPMLATADAFFLPMRPGTRDASVPSKLISYLAAGRPVITATPAGAATMEVVRSNEAGISVETGNPDAIAGAVLELANDPTRARQLGKNARQAFEELFAFSKSYPQFKSLIQKHAEPSVSRKIPAVVPVPDDAPGSD